MFFVFNSFRIRYVETVEADAVVEARRSFVELEFGEDWPGLSAGYDNLPADMQVCFLKFYILLFIECFFENVHIKYMPLHTNQYVIFSDYVTIQLFLRGFAEDRSRLYHRTD